jgi:hypothetical protein
VRESFQLVVWMSLAGATRSTDVAPNFDVCAGLERVQRWSWLSEPPTQIRLTAG